MHGIVLIITFNQIVFHEQSLIIVYTIQKLHFHNTFEYRQKISYLCSKKLPASGVLHPQTPDMGPQQLRPMLAISPQT